MALSKIAYATIYTLSITYNTTNFFTSFDFFNEEDPANSFVEYVDFETAVSEGLPGDRNGAIYMGVDTTTVSHASGRKSVRIHIIEGVNTQVHNTITLHTGFGCYITNEGTLESTTLLDTANYQNYSNSFNANGGGVYAIEWTSDYISIWFFARNQIPDNIKTEFLDPSAWGLPTARFIGGSGCNTDTYFMSNSLVFDTTFCRDQCGDTASIPSWSSFDIDCQHP
ncbi:hypothetical protein BKA56DRAFT_638499 [Ilyonectria sp. MPI-CAGE-AT-0026]|nr:hypothetical protein BKA56DRAFT_638499 [Ilyonectria sp. MPI-CAGE-AT-0026]